MLDSLFQSGTLLMSERPVPACCEAVRWIDCPLNRILLITCVVIMVITANLIVFIIPSILDCLSRWKANLTIEHNLSVARNRSIVLMIFILAFLLICDYYGLVHSDYLARLLKPELKILSTAAVILAYMFLRFIIFVIVRPSSVNSFEGEITLAYHRANFNYFICAVMVMMVTAGIFGILSRFNEVDIITKRYVLWAELALFYIINIIRTGQIIHYRKGQFLTFLYLCALEFIPTAAIIVASLYL